MGKLKIRIMNIVYLAISGFALFWYSLNFINPDKVPFLKVGFSAELTAENSADLIKDDMLTDLGLTREELFESGPISIDADIQIKNQMLLDAWKAEDPNKFVEDTFINPNVDALVEDLKPAFMNVAKTAAKSVLKTEMENQLKEHVSGGDLYAALASSNPELTPEKLSDDIGTVIDELLKPDATLDSVSSVLAEKYSVYNTALGGEAKTQEQMEDMIKDTFEEYNLVDENGEISDIDEIIAFFLDGMLGEGESKSDDKKGDEGGDKPEAILRRMLTPNFEAGKEENESAIAAKLKTILNEKLDGAKDTMVLAFKACGIALGVFMLGWAIKVVQVILGFFRKKPYVRTEIIGIIAGIVQFVLALVSILVLAAFKFNLLGMATGLPVVGDLISGMPFLTSGISLELTFSAMIPGILVLVNAIYSIFYGIAKRRFKRDYKREKRAAQNA